MNATLKPLTDLTAGELMTRDVITVPKHLSLRAAAHLLSQHQVTGAPVVDEDGVCIGVISGIDFMHWAENGCKDRVRTSCRECVCADWQVVEIELLPTEDVAAHMSSDPVVASPDAPIGRLALAMLDAHIHRVIVVDDRGRPVGVVSSTDILAAVARAGMAQE